MENLNGMSCGRALRVRPRSGARRGLATVEAALVFPLLLVLTLGVIEYGWMFLKQQQITNAARQGARLAATPFAGNGELSARVSELMTDAGLAGKYTLATSPGNIDGVIPGDTFTVTITVDYSDVTITHMSDPDNMIHLPAPNNLKAVVAMAKEGP